MNTKKVLFGAFTIAIKLIEIKYCSLQIYLRPVCCKMLGKTFKLHCLLLIQINDDLKSI